MPDSNSIKLCECGCGKPAPIAKKTYRKFGHVVGQPMRFIRWHYRRGAKDSPRLKHGHRQGSEQSRTYVTWNSMITRCTNPNVKEWPRYGGRGIKICKRWRKFENFLADMGEKPQGLSIDRIDNDGNYEPNNCRWADRITQAMTSRRSRLITAFSETKTILQWTNDKRCVVKYGTLMMRLSYNWPIEIALSAPPYSIKRNTYSS